MRIPGSSAYAIAIPTFLLPLLVSAVGKYDCNLMVAEGIRFDFSALGGPRSVIHDKQHGNLSLERTTYTLDICKPLGKIKGTDIPISEQCPMGSRICAITRLIQGDDHRVESVTPIAGELRGNGGGDMNAKYTRLKTSKASGDMGKEGLRLELSGGFVKDDASRKQQAVIEFLCDKELDGLENLPNPEDQYDQVMEKRDENGTTPSLQFLNYDRNGDNTGDILQLTWRSKYGCEDYKQQKDAEQKGRWGFFTWFIIIAFMGTATYLIFGSWLNYNRYGARGWDLLPHSDTIRDVPYLMKDWMRKVVNTVQGPGSRGGYAAV